MEEEPGPGIADPREERAMDIDSHAPRIVSQLAYDNVGAALEWLAVVFGFCELEEQRFVGEDGEVGHAEMEVGPGVHFMLGASGGHGSTSPKALGGRSQHLCVYVDDVEAHLARARDAGATIVAELEDQFWGDRTYEAEDLEGHRWMFCQRVRDVKPGDWQKALGEQG